MDIIIESTNQALTQEYFQQIFIFHLSKYKI